MIRNKTIKFDMDKEEDRALWEWLEKRPHGYFSHFTKKVWKDTMDKDLIVEESIRRWNEEKTREDK